MKRLFASVFCALLLQGSALATTLQTQIGDISIPTAKETMNKLILLPPMLHLMMIKKHLERCIKQV